MKRIYRTPSAAGGFSLIEVMIAVVVLATGLLALAALQASLTRSSAEAKVRSRVAAMLTARMDELRGGGYDNATLDVNTGTGVQDTTFNCTSGNPAWLCTAQGQANLSALTVTQRVELWTSAVGAGSFAIDGTPGDADPEFKRVVLGATWTDSGNTSHRLAMTSEFSVLALRDSLLPAPPASSTPTGGPIVRTDSPATAGVIPIALGNGDSTAASNPTPELVGANNNQTIVGTRFNVLTYTGSGTSAVIQKRFENDVIKCKCQYGAGGNNLPEIYRTSAWPAIWTGERYDVYTPSSATDAPGQAFSSGPVSNVDQSALCQECCRDHHDTTTTGVAKFDPERSDGSTSKYDPDGSGNLIQVNNTSSGTYVNSCRMIRVDGFWRTASDLYARQFGLLETESQSGVKAKTGLPTTSATTAYTTFVKDYLEQYTGAVGTAPAGAQTMFDETSRGLNTPALVEIATPSTSDYRYLHGRGLYVDYLEEEAREKLVAVLADNGAQGKCPTGSEIADCILPYLPFTSVNLTEIATWVASSTSVLGVNSGNLLSTNPSQPSGGRTFGKVNGTADNTTTMRMSNSGVAINTGFTLLAGVDPTDDSAVSSDTQAFEVGGTPGAGTGDEFFVQISGGGVNPFVFFAITATGDSGECIKPATGDRTCTTSSTLPQAGSVRLENYWVETTTSQRVVTTCAGDPATDTILVPTFRNYAVTSATGAAGGNGTIGVSVNDGKETETTTITFGSIAANDTIVFTLTEQTGSPTYATVQSCTTNGGGNKINNVVWNKPWENP